MSFNMTLIKPSLVKLLVGVSLTGITAGLLYLLLGKDEDDVEEIVQRIKTSRSATIEVKIPKDCVGVVIGRGGANIKEIQDKSDTKINFKDEQNDENFRVCVIRGAPEAAQLAESLIHEFISNQPLIEVTSILVPQNACGRIIGRNGENIRSISRASSAKITVESSGTNDKTCATGPVRRVFIKGTGDQIELAKALIQEKVEEDAEIRKKMESLNARPPRGKDNLLFLTAGGDNNQVQNATDASEKLAAVSSDGSVEVYVSAVCSPSTFWVQMYGPRAVDLDFLVDQMTEYYNKDENRELHAITSPLQVNQMVAAPFQYDDKWYRAKVVIIKEDEYNTNDSSVEVYYVDYGDVLWVKQSELFRLRTDFLQLRFQAIECSLANVVPKGEAWSDEATAAFESLVNVAHWVKMTARVKSYQEGFGHGTRFSGLQAPCIDLFDSRGSQDVSVAEELVKQGFAEWRKESPERRSTSLSRSSSARASASPSPLSSRRSVASEKGAGDASSVNGKEGRKFLNTPKFSSKPALKQEEENLTENLASGEERNETQVESKDAGEGSLDPSNSPLKASQSANESHRPVQMKSPAAPAAPAEKPPAGPRSFLPPEVLLSEEEDDLDGFDAP